MDLKEAQQAKTTVYVVEDDTVIRGVMQSVVEMMGLAVEAYVSAEDFLAAYQPARAGCVLLDMDLPGMSGLQLQAEIKRRTWSVPVVLITAPGAQTVQYEALRRGAAAVVEKPCLIEEVTKVIEKAIAGDKTGEV